MLGYYEWREGLLRGLAAHHAGMLPAFRHTVEELFTAGLVRAVFATETLALGINMPARTVVLERLVKFNGEAHVPLTPGEYTQLTGRAGRRGIDVEGHAVVLWHPGEETSEPSAVAGLASTRTFPLRSSFAPSYNMTINLVQQMGPEQAHQLLEQSFAQYQADRSVVGLVRGIDRGKRMADEIAAELGGAEAPILEYARMRARISEMERAQSRASRLHRRQAANQALAGLRRGDIITITHGRHSGLAVVLEVGPRRRRPAAAGAHRTPLGGPDFVGRLLGRFRAGRIDVAAQAGRTPSAAGCAATWPRRCGRPPPGWTFRLAVAPRDADGGFHDPELASLRAELRRHPAHNSPGVEAGVREAERYLRIERDNAQLGKKVAAATNSLARTFDRIVGLLTEREFIQGSAADPRVTDDGRLLARIYSESDLLVAECLRTGAWAGLKPAELAAVVSSVVYETRGGDGPGAPFAAEAPTPKLRRALQQTAKLSSRCAPTSRPTASRRAANPTTASSPPSTNGPGPATWPAALAAADATGSGSPLLAGDFVRWCRQVLDLLDQVRNAAPDAELRARQSAPSTTFGAASSQLTPGRLGPSYRCERRVDTQAIEEK